MNFRTKLKSVFTVIAWFVFVFFVLGALIVASGYWFPRLNKISDTWYLKMSWNRKEAKAQVNFQPHRGHIVCIGHNPHAMDINARSEECRLPLFKMACLAEYRGVFGWLYEHTNQSLHDSRQHFCFVIVMMPMSEPKVTWCAQFFNNNNCCAACYYNHTTQYHPQARVLSTHRGQDTCDQYIRW